MKYAWGHIQDSAEKEKQRQHQEMADARAAFEQYGSARFMRTFWRFIAMDHPDSICLKFLRARKWAPTAVSACVRPAVVHLSSAMDLPGPPCPALSVSWAILADTQW